MGIPSNLIPVNASQISGSAQSIAGEIPIDSVEIPQASVLSSVIPDSLFEEGSIDQIRARTLGKAEQYLAPLNALPIKKPSFGSIKNYIETKIDRIKTQRRNASVRALKQELQQQKNPFQYRQSLRNGE